jgi:hypothetical protein
MFFHFEGADPSFASHVAMYVGCCGPNQADVVSASSPSEGITWRTKSAYKNVSGFLGFGRITTPSVGIRFAAHSPVELTVTDPDGFTITPDTHITTSEEVLREIPGILYYSESDIDGDGRPGAHVYSPTFKIGFYVIHVAPKADALPTDTYGLDVEAAGKMLVLAKDVPIREIPREGYGVSSTEGGDPTMFIPVALDIQPGDTPNSIQSRKSGKIPVAIMSTPTFSAPNRIAADALSLTFGRTGDEPSLVSCSREDVNRDGSIDLVCQFSATLAGFRVGDTVGVLKGKTREGTPIMGMDTVRILR